MRRFLLLFVICLFPTLVVALPMSRHSPKYHRVLQQKSFGLTVPCDNLWQVSKHLAKHHTYSTQQVMLALLHHNPKAFYNRNINGLMTGFMLHVPSSQKIQSISKKDAVYEVARQNKAWKSVLVKWSKKQGPMYRKFSKVICADDHNLQLPHRMHYHHGSSKSIKLVTSVVHSIVAPKHQFPIAAAIPNHQQITLTDDSQGKIKALQEQIAGLQKRNNILNTQVVDLIRQRERWQMINLQQMKTLAQFEQQIVTLNRQFVQNATRNIPTVSQVTHKLTSSALITPSIVRFSYDGNSNIEKFLSYYPFINRIVHAPNFKPLVFIAMIIFTLIIVIIIWTIISRRNKKIPSVKTTEIMPEESESDEATTQSESSVSEDTDNYSYLAGEDVITSKLDLAHAYIDMGEKDQARELLESVIKEGNDTQREEANVLLQSVKQQS